MLSGGTPQRLAAPDFDAIPAPFRHFVSRCCDSDPTARYPDAGEALGAFEILTATSSPRTPNDPPLQVAERLIQEWTNAPVGPDLEVLRKLDEHLSRFADEEELYFDLIPRLPRNLVEQYMDELGGAFAAMLAHYDEHISGGLPFSYCDVVANFYEFVFINSGNPIVRRLIIARLIDMGASHNRWHVGGVLAGMLAGIEDAGTDQLAAEAIRADPYHARWFLPYVETLELPRQVAAAFDSSKRRLSRRLRTSRSEAVEILE